MAKTLATILIFLHKYREYFPAQLKLGLKRRVEKKYSHDGLSNNFLDYMADEVETFLSNNCPPLYPARFDVYPNWIGSLNLPISATTAILGFILKGQIITADTVHVTVENYPVIMASLKSFDEEFFWERFRKALKRKLNHSWREKYRIIAEDLEKKTQLGLEYLKGLANDPPKVITQNTEGSSLVEVRPGEYVDFSDPKAIELFLLEEAQEASAEAICDDNPLDYFLDFTAQEYRAEKRKFQR